MYHCTLPSVLLFPSCWFPYPPDSSSSVLCFCRHISGTYMNTYTHTWIHLLCMHIHIVISGFHLWEQAHSACLAPPPWKPQGRSMAASSIINLWTTWAPVTSRGFWEARAWHSARVSTFGTWCFPLLSFPSSILCPMETQRFNYPDSENSNKKCRWNKFYSCFRNKIKKQNPKQNAWV